MSTLADELLQDFEDFGSDEDVAADDAADGDASPAANGLAGDMSEGEDQEDEVMEDATDEAKAVASMDDAEEAKTKVEKMKLGVVKDVRSVATLMDTLSPVLEVSRTPPPPSSPLLADCEICESSFTTLSLSDASPDIMGRTTLANREMPVARAAGRRDRKRRRPP